MNMREIINLVEGFDFDKVEPTGSFGWWIYPNGDIEEMQEMGSHGVTAHFWLQDHGVNEDDYSTAIEVLKSLGGARVATFHGSEDMNIDFDPKHITTSAQRALIALIRQTRREFSGYWFEAGSATPSVVDYNEAMRILRATQTR